MLDGEICRICLFNSEPNNDTNPMISLCKCKGSVNHVHLNCLKLWLEQKLSIREFQNGRPGISYTIKSFNCELCKEPYPRISIYINI
jgi:E3 ubiquitin-protein ligase DOA10